MLLSTGEVSIKEFLDDVRVGQTVRLSDIPVEVVSGTAFEQFRPDAAGKQFYVATGEYHGAVGHDWLQYLVGQTPKKFKPRLNELRKTFLAQPAVAEIFAQAHSQVVSVINRLALVAATLAMAIEAKILPWSQADTDDAIIACMQRWLRERGNVDAAGELLRQIEQRRRTTAATIDDHFIRLSVEGRRLVPASAADQHKMERADEFDGYIKNGHLLVTPEAWRQRWAGLNLEDVNKHLLKANLLIPDREGKASRAEKYNSDAPAKRFYVLAPAFIDGVTV
jgi:hypothetical protein